MTFVFPLLLGGLVLTGIPVVLHLIVRRKPKRLPFPAFRFLAQQQRSNLRKLRLRHLLLLLLRVFLIAAMCLLLARPRLFHRVLGLDGDRPIQAVLLFDTSASMEYRSSDGSSRLDEAKQHARDLLDQELPSGSQVAIVDSADARLDQPLEWLSVSDARQRIGNLKIRYANGPVTQALVKLLAQLDESDQKATPSGPARLRVLAVFSDRTRGSWDGTHVPALVDKLDRIAPTYEGLVEARGEIGALADLLRELRSQAPPPPGKDYNEQALLEALSAMQQDVTGLMPEAQRWPPELAGSVRQVRRQCRDMLGQLPPREPSPTDSAQAFLAKLRAALGGMLRATGGVQLLFIDVGIETPVDLALAALELKRTSQGVEQQVFAEGEPFTLNAVVQATGKDAAVTVACQAGEARQETQIALKAGERQTVPFYIGEGKLQLKPGDNSIEVHLDARPEAMPHGHHRFVTVRVRPRQNVVIVTDDPERADLCAAWLEALRYDVRVQAPQTLSKDGLAGSAAVYLLGVAAPGEKLWDALRDYVHGGGGLCVVPAGGDLTISAYTQPAALKVLPATIEGKIDSKNPAGSAWNWDERSAKYNHTFMKRFKAWKDMPRMDFMVLPRGAFSFWDVKPRAGEALVLVPYTDGKPAVLERLFDAKSGTRGKVLMLTTPLDAQQPVWNNYRESVTKFLPSLLMQATGYLAGEADAPQLNFTLGRGDPVVTLAAGPTPATLATLRGPELRPLTLDLGQAQLVVRELTLPGNYLIEGKAKESGELRRLAGFSVNVPAEECDLTKVPAGDLEPLIGPDALMALGRQGSLHDAMQSYRSEPLDLMPYFMLALLFALALENLLANKFYRQPDV
jgi:hypothetical protein